MTMTTTPASKPAASSRPPHVGDTPDPPRGIVVRAPDAAQHSRPKPVDIGGPAWDDARVWTLAIPDDNSTEHTRLSRRPSVGALWQGSVLTTAAGCA